MKVNLKVKEDNTVQTVQHEIEKVNILQITDAVKVIKDIFVSAKDNENLQALIQDILDEFQSGQDKEIAEVGMKILKRAIDSMDLLLVELPEKTLELFSILSGVEYDTLVRQKAEDVFDIYDAVIQVNDIDKLIKRAKKSLELTKAQVKVMSLFNPNKQTEQAQA